jgi:DNA-binding MarR family transcriptional regulator
MSMRKVHHTHISRALPQLHRSLMEIVGAINQPERDDVILAMAGLSLERALFPLIVLIERMGPIGVVDLAGRVGRDYTTVSRQTARLEQLELIERRGGEADRRVREAFITAKGRAITARVDQARDAMARVLFKEWSTHDFDELVRLIGRLAHDMQADGKTT